jgi:beta-mannosidase
MSSIIIDLNGTWKFRRANSNEKILPAQVPGCVHTDLLSNKQIPDPFWGSNELELEWIERVDWEYTRTFIITPEIVSRQCVELVADGLDTIASIYINNTFVERTENMFVGYRFNIKSMLKPGSNTIRILFENPSDYIKARKTPDDFWEWNDPVGGASKIRKQQCSFGWDWGARFATSGIYKSISIHAFDVNRIASVLIEQTHHDGKVTLTCKPTLALPESTGLSWRCALNGEFHEESDSLTMVVDNPKLWWPNGLGEHPLYEVAVELLYKDEVIDT